MADNVKPSTDPTVATDEIEGRHIQRVKVQHGADGSATDVSSASPLPVDDATAKALLEAIGALLSTIDGDTDAIAASTGLLDNAIAGSEMQVDVITLPELPTGTKAIGKLAANSGVDIGDVDVTSIAAGTNTIGNVGLAPRTSGGLSIFRSLDLDETEEQVKGTAGQIYGYYFSNLAAATRYLKFYNATEASVTVGTTTPVMTLPLPKESSGHVPIPHGLAFSTAITVAVTTGLADNSTGAPAEGDVVLNLYYA